MHDSIWTLVQKIVTPLRVARRLRPRKILHSIFYHLQGYRFFRFRLQGLHLGAGDFPIPEFLNIDANPMALCDLTAGVERLKLRRESVAVIYNSHVFEHVPRASADKVLREWYRVLVPGGKLILCVPDMEILTKIYLTGIQNYKLSEAKRNVEMACGIIFGGQRDRYDFHFFGYSFETICSMLELAGFREIQRINVQSLPFYNRPDAAMASISGIPVSLNVEAIKPEI